MTYFPKIRRCNERIEAALVKNCAIGSDNDQEFELDAWRESMDSIRHGRNTDN